MTSLTGNKTGRGRPRKAFTLIEMLVVITILVLLVLIAIPTAILVRKNVARDLSQATVNLLDTGCKMFKNDFGYYPPSDYNADSRLPSMSGGQLLCLFLTGYPPDADPKGMPGLDQTVDDGKDGYGFRMQPRGKVYGPYNGAEEVETFREGNNAPYFKDGFGNPILYYSYVQTEAFQGYLDTDNNTVPDKPDNFNTEYSKNSDDEYYRTDFSLCSKGADEKWTTYRDDDTPNEESDDITNFFLGK